MSNLLNACTVCVGLDPCYKGLVLNHKDERISCPLESGFSLKIEVYPENFRVSEGNVPSFHHSYDLNRTGRPNFRSEIDPMEKGGGVTYSKTFNEWK